MKTGGPDAGSLGRRNADVGPAEWSSAQAEGHHGGIARVVVLRLDLVGRPVRHQEHQEGCPSICTWRHVTADACASPRRARVSCLQASSCTSADQSVSPCPPAPQHRRPPIQRILVGCPGSAHASTVDA